MGLLLFPVAKNSVLTACFGVIRVVKRGTRAVGTVLSPFLPGDPLAKKRQMSKLEDGTSHAPLRHAVRVADKSFSGARM